MPKKYSGMTAKEKEEVSHQLKKYYTGGLSYGNTSRRMFKKHNIDISSSTVGSVLQGMDVPVRRQKDYY